MKNKTIWSNRFKNKTSQSFLKIGSSIHIDKRLYEQDIASSVVHTQMLVKQKIIKSEGQINWNDDALMIIGKINGLYPFPGAFFNFNGERYKILRAEIGHGNGKNGEVISDGLEIGCGDNKSIKVLEIQREGKKVQKIHEFLPGSQIKKGSIIHYV